MPDVILSTVCACVYVLSEYVCVCVCNSLNTYTHTDSLNIHRHPLKVGILLTPLQIRKLKPKRFIKLAKAMTILKPGIASDFLS